MQDESGAVVVERQFFSSLISSDVVALDRILADDFVLIDVMSGSEIARADLLAVLGSGLLKFEAIEPMGYRIRLHGATSIITGRTQMSGRFGETPFLASSRYTHVYVKEHDQWLLVAAQGTQITS